MGRLGEPDSQLVSARSADMIVQLHRVGDALDRIEDRLTQAVGELTRLADAMQDRQHNNPFEKLTEAATSYIQRRI